MKKIIVSLILFSFLFIKCSDKNSNNPVEYIDSQLVYVVMSSDFNTESVNGLIYTFIQGKLYSNRLPKLFYLDAGKARFTLGQNLDRTYENGVINFSGYYADVVFQGDFEVNTSEGSITGQVNPPFITEKLKTTLTDSLVKGEPLTVSWEGSKADFYIISCYYITNRQSHDIMESITTEKNITISSEQLDPVFVENDCTLRIYVSAVNGPFPEIGAAANLAGEGSGFLYYAKTANRLDLQIKDDAGFLMKQAAAGKNDSRFNEILFDRLLNGVK